MNSPEINDRYVSVKGAVGYTSLSERNIRAHLKEIEHFRVGGKILFKLSDLDTWLERFRVRRDGPDLDQIAAEAVESILT